MKDIRFVDELAREQDLKGQRVLVRCDFNVPLDGDGRITDDARITSVRPTLEFLLQRGARLVLCSHLGRPKGKRNPDFSLLPVAERLGELLEAEMLLADEPAGDGARKLAQDLREGQILLLENLRFNAGETADDEEFARELGSYAEFYVNDAFGAAHRAHGSVHAVVQHFPQEARAAGLLIRRELTHLGRLVEEHPARPFVLVAGGAKVSDKIGVVERLVPRLDTIIIGGAMAYSFLAVRGVSVGNSRVEKDKLRVAESVLDRAETAGVKVLLPQDHVVADTFEGEGVVTVNDVAIPEGKMGLDIGPKTRARYCDAIRQASTVFWNGPMGVFEAPRFAEGTRDVARAIADVRGDSIVGGGDSAAAARLFEVDDLVTHVSTGGGAALEFLEGKALPGLVALTAPQTTG